MREGASRQRSLRHMADIVDSVLTCGGARYLAGLTSWYDLVVTNRSVPDYPGVGVVIVRTPLTSGEGQVLIEHWSATGHNERIRRPVDEALPLFWRFMIEKFGVAPVRPGV